MSDQSARLTPASPFSAMLRGAFVPSVVGAVVTVVVFGVIRGLSGAEGALFGAGIALVFFGVGLWLMTRLVSANPISVFAGAMAVYFGQVIFMGVIILTMRDVTWLDGLACGITILVVTLVWQVFQARAYLRLRQTVYDEPSPTAASSTERPDEAGRAAGRPGEDA